MAEETLVDVLCEENECAANRGKAKHVSMYCTCSCSDANGPLVEKLSLVEGPLPADETSLVDGPARCPQLTTSDIIRP